MTTPNTDSAPAAPAAPSDFIRDIVAADLQSGRHSQIHTRFPPEPNGYLHIGHAKSICLNFGIAHEFGGVCNLRMDDTNPTKEDVEYVDSIQADVNWLIAGWADGQLGLKSKGQTAKGVTSNGREDFLLAPVVPGAASPAAGLEPFYASDYFAQIYAYAVQLVKQGHAYVCDLSPGDVDTHRGSPDRPGTDSPFRNRSVEENLDLFQRMKAGEPLEDLAVKLVTGFSYGAKTGRGALGFTRQFNDPITRLEMDDVRSAYRRLSAQEHRLGDGAGRRAGDSATQPPAQLGLPEVGAADAPQLGVVHGPGRKAGPVQDDLGVDDGGESRASWEASLLDRPRDAPRADGGDVGLAAGQYPTQEAGGCVETGRGFDFR